MTCCSKPSIQTMDYKWPCFEEVQVTKVNRVCLHCWTHWFGVDGDVKQYTAKEWESYINGALVDK